MVCRLVWAGLNAAREPSAKSTRNDSDEPPLLTLTRAMGWLRTRPSSRSSDIPRNTPAGSIAIRGSGGDEMSCRGGIAQRQLLAGTGLQPPSHRPTRPAGRATHGEDRGADQRHLEEDVAQEPHGTSLHLIAASDC